MSTNNLYIGIPNGVVLCADEVLQHDAFRGRMYHRYSKDAIPIHSFRELIDEMEQLFDEIQFPRAGTRDRSFTDKPQVYGNGMKERERIMSDKDLLKMHGDIGTFIIKVQQRQGGTWQGRITWVDHNKTVRFRSVLEMIKLIEDGITADHPELLEEDDAPSWED